MLTYPVKLKPDSDGFIVSFPDIPEALTCGESREKALEMAQDALIASFDFYFEDKRTVPMPSKIEEGQDFIEVPASLTAKILLLNTMLEKKVRSAELARMLQTTAQEVNRLTNVKHATKIDSIAAALGKLGKRLELRLTDM